MDDLARLRLVLARELETINEYEAHAREASTEKLRAFFKHLADEEKEHVAEAMALIHELDPVQAQEADEVKTDHAHFTGTAGPASPATKPTPMSRLQWTIGSLKKGPST